MRTKKQDELIDSLLSELDEDVKPLYGDIIAYLSELGYNPQKEKSSLSFKHSRHSKQMAKMGFRTTKQNGTAPFFALRFSACQGYSQRFTDIVGDYIAKYPKRAAVCVDGRCTYCAGVPFTHVYTSATSGDNTAHCGAYAVEIPDITAGDADEIKRLIKEEHEYLMRYEAAEK